MFNPHRIGLGHQQGRRFISRCTNRELKQRRRRRKQEQQPSNRFIDWQNNNFARASRFFVHFFAVTAQLRRSERREDA